MIEKNLVSIDGKFNQCIEMMDERWGLFAFYEGFCNTLDVMKDVPFVF